MQHAVPPQFVQRDDIRIVVPAEDQVVLHQPGVARQAVGPQEEPHPQQAEHAQILHVQALARLLVGTVPVGMAHPAVLHPGHRLDARRTVERPVQQGDVAVDPHAAVIVRQQQMRMHLGPAGVQRGVAEGFRQLPDLPGADAPGRLLPLPDEADEVEAFRRCKGLLQLVIAADDASIDRDPVHHLKGILK